MRDISPILKAALKERKSIVVDDAITLDGIHYSIGFDPQHDNFTFRWEEDGEQRSQSIRVVAKQCNLLMRARLYYFVCPITSARCIYLYKAIGGGFFSIKAMPNARYPMQMLSPKQRRLHSPPEEEAPYKHYGKRIYRLKLTPYGRKCKRYEQAQERAEHNLEQLLNFYQNK